MFGGLRHYLFESGQGTRKKSTFAGSKRWDNDLCLLFFLSRSPAKEEITLPFPLPTRARSPESLNPQLVNKNPSVHSACLLPSALGWKSWR